MQLFYQPLTGASSEFSSPSASCAAFFCLNRGGRLVPSTRLAELTNRTLLLTKLESQRFVPDRTAFSLDEQIRRCAILCAHSWEEKRLTFSAELESVDCTSNEELLRQVWINLLNNAIRYTPPGGEIGVELR